eukprot:gene4308-4358_t
MTADRNRQQRRKLPMAPHPAADAAACCVVSDAAVPHAAARRVPPQSKDVIVTQAEITASFGPAPGDRSTLPKRCGATLEALFRHPLAHNLEWSDVIALFEHLGTAAVKPHGEIVFAIGTEHLRMHRPHGKDIDPADLMALRHVLQRTGWSPVSAQAAPLPSTPATPHPATPPDLMVVVDHREARIYHLEISAVDIADHVIRPYDPHHFLHHLSHRDQPNERGQRTPEDHQFYVRIAEAIADAGKIVLVGRGHGHSNAAQHLAQFLRNSHPATANKIADVLNEDFAALTAPQLLDLGRRALRGIAVARPIASTSSAYMNGLRRITCASPRIVSIAVTPLSPWSSASTIIRSGRSREAAATAPASVASMPHTTCPISSSIAASNVAMIASSSTTRMRSGLASVAPEGFGIITTSVRRFGSNAQLRKILTPDYSASPNHSNDAAIGQGRIMPGKPVEHTGQNGASQRDAARPPATLRIVGIGASAGGLEACIAFLEALPANPAMAFILVQHLDPTHESLMVELLATHTALAVITAQDGMQVEQDHLYVIPPASFLTLTGGVLHLRRAPSPRGARLPFDMLLTSMAADCGVRASCVVLSGTGTDGSAGALAIKAQGGFVIAQDPTEAGYDGMPRSAIATGAVDRTLPVSAMATALLARPPGKAPATASKSSTPDRLSDIVDLLRSRTSHDFTLYKPGTLRRRVERRMAMCALPAHDMGAYVTLLESDPAELERLAKDLLIHVTSFFRDPAVFEHLSNRIAPDLVRGPHADNTLRLWVAGCSTGEEAYSLAIIMAEQIQSAGSQVKLQIFASDADADAVATAREGVYPATIAADISPARLAAFFIKEDTCYRVMPDLRAMIVFTVQDLLTDPPFSRLDLVSCRNVLIYLDPQGQRKIISLFHFSLRPGGILLLGSSEGVGDAAGRFAVMSKDARLYRHIGRSRPGDVDFARSAGDNLRGVTSTAQAAQPSRLAALAELCRIETLATHAPATVLATRKHEYLYALGPIDRYLRVAPGHATTDILAMVGAELRTRMRSAIVRAIQDNAPVAANGGHVEHGGQSFALTIEVHPISHDGEDLLLIHFIAQPAPESFDVTAPADAPRVAELERELKTTRNDLQGAIRSLEIAGDEQKAINENALSVNEEFQSTNEELLTSKEELQSLNEELTALNSQLQETLEQQRTSANDLQNVLFSTDVATLFLDTQLRIRFFTPATRCLFNVIKTDVGRPLTDLHSLAADEALASDARTVLQSLNPIEHEVETATGTWCRRILPYRTHDGVVEGVVITFTDITGRKHIAQVLEAARREADIANAAKSQFLAAASHDLRQPLQTLALLQGLLASRTAGTQAADLVSRLADTVSTMSGMLNTLLDINQIEAGIIKPEKVDFPIGDVLGNLAAAFAYQAQAKGLQLHIMPCSAMVHSDPHLLEQILCNLVSNALKYTVKGKVLVGCRRSAGTLRIEVLDTGIGIPEAELDLIFQEFRQLDNVARERARGLGLGLSIVRRLGALLGHAITVRSRQGRGSVFSVSVPICASTPVLQVAPKQLPPAGPLPSPAGASTVMVVDDEPEVRALLALILSDTGLVPLVAADGPRAIELIDDGAVPDLLLTDYNLPNGMDGLAVAAKIRARLGAALPVIILTGDISTQALSAIAGEGCLQLNKPVNPTELRQQIHTLLARAKAPPAQGRVSQIPPGHDGKIVYVVDDDHQIRGIIRLLLEDDGRMVQDFESCEAFLASYSAASDGCLLVDAYLPGMCGLDLLKSLRASGDTIPTIMITGHSDVGTAVQAMKAGASNFIEKPISGADLLASIDRAMARGADSRKQLEWHRSAAEHMAGLTPRQHEIMDLVLAGHPSKNIAADLKISQRTVENHRSAIMRKTGAASLPALTRLALAASDDRAQPARVQPSFPILPHAGTGADNVTPSAQASSIVVWSSPARQGSETSPKPPHAYLVGGGIASMAAAVFMIRDGDMFGYNITIIEESNRIGGSLDGDGSPASGYVLRGGRMLEAKYLCTWALFDSIPTLDETQTVTQETMRWNETMKTSSKSRLFRDGQRQVAPKFGLSERHILTIERLVLEPESLLGSTSIAEQFDAAFLHTEFWLMWCTTFAFQPWHSAVEFKRYLTRFIHMVHGFDRLHGILRTVYNQNDSMVRPLRKWLTERGVTFELGSTVTDLGFARHEGASSVDRIEVHRKGVRAKISVTPRDYVLVTLGSMTEASTLGSTDQPPPLAGKSEGGAWTLWETIARDRPEFGHPAVFAGHVDQSKWVSFTTTLHDPALLRLVMHRTGNVPGEGGLVTFAGSAWNLSIVIPHQPHFIGQPRDVQVFWGYGLNVDTPGDFVPKTMASCTGREIMTELLGHLRIEREAEAIIAGAICIPCMMPFITSQFLCRDATDRPAVLPKGVQNLAFIGQFCEIPDDVVFTVEYSIRSAQLAVYGLLGLRLKPPAVYKGKFDARVLLKAFRALHDLAS